MAVAALAGVLALAPSALATPAGWGEPAPGPVTAVPGAPLTLSGQVLAAGRPVAGARVVVSVAGAGGAMPVGSARTGPRGQFTVGYTAPAGTGPLYLVASGGRTRAGSALRLMGVAGTADRPLPSVVVSELTTVGSVFALSRFIDGVTVSGPSPGMPNAAALVANLVEPSTGKVSFVVANPPNGSATTTLATLRTLANLVAGCASGGPPDCRRLFAATATGRGPRPRDTMQAVLGIARFPARNVRRIFELARPDVFTPALTAEPTSWALALKYTGWGLNAPGRMAFDALGNAWIGNNFQTPGTTAGLLVTALTPTGLPLPGSPFQGGGVRAPGFGTAVDQQGRVWIGNFAGNSISVLSPTGAPLSPAAGYTDGGISKPQGLAIDRQGNVWIPNYGNGTVTQYPGGDPARHRVFSGGGLTKPFAIAVDAEGAAWVTDNSTSPTRGSVTRIAADGTVTGPITGGGLRSPQGIAIDSAGTKWVANLAGQGVTTITPDGRIGPRSPIRAPGMRGPWGIAVDGDDNVWVADFLGATLTQLCGRRPSTCPPGTRTGEPVSPRRTGYDTGDLQHLTAVQVDPSGNVWVADNWSTGSSLSQFVGGDGVVQYIGIAAPVRTPLIGPPERP